MKGNMNESSLNNIWRSKKEKGGGSGNGEAKKERRRRRRYIYIYIYIYYIYIYIYIYIYTRSILSFICMPIGPLLGYCGVSCCNCSKPHVAIRGTLSV